MKEKIINTRNILKIVIMVLVIFSMIKSCSKAYTPEDFHDFLGYCVQHQITSNNSYNLTKVTDIYNNWNTYMGYIQGAGYDLANYNNFLIGISGSGNSPCILAYNGTITYSCSNYTTSFNSTTFTQFMFKSNNVTISTTTRSQNNGYAFIFDGSPTNNTFDNCISINKWSYVNILPISDLKTSNLPWYIADVRIAEATPNAQIYLYNNGEPVGELQTISHSVAGGTLYQVEIINTNGLINNTSYSLKLYNDTSLLTSSEDFTLQWTNDSTPSQPSGDTSGDNGGYCMCGPYLIKIIDILSGDIYGQIIHNGELINGSIQDMNNQLKENNEAVKDLTTALLGESGESGEKGFLEKMYDKLFTVSEEEVQEVIENIRENTHIDNIGMASGEIAILNTLTGEPHDFIINWGAANYMGETIIPSGEINFSATVREIPVLQNVIDWVRILLGFSVVSILIMEIWFTLLKCLGVSTSIYEQQQHEIEMLEAQYETKEYVTQVATPNGLRNYRTLRKRIRR